MLKKFVHNIFGRFGYRIERMEKLSPVREVDKWLKNENIGTFIDVGAFKGEYVDFALHYFSDVEIFAFEPLNDYCARLKNRTRKYGNCHIYNYALGEKDGSLAFNRSSYAPSSSLLTMGPRHKDDFPFSADSRSEIVTVRTLDGILGERNLTAEIFVKIDTQGYEDRIIEGGKSLLSRARIIQVEVSFVELYENQVLFDTIFDKLRALGFGFHGIKNQVCSPRDGAILQAHAYFVKGGF